ncbi:hypothetical protein F5Y04DRAFT_146624 [Hypomontagnella monticulosa]|nr:hypothetical protein F5Y04DRAFT_146624 [Hypomontagnella monticulosa]
MDSERLKQLEKAEEELQRRRERGKLAQRAFRKRQSKVSQDKRDETQKLRDAVGKIVRVLRRDDRPELIRAVQEAAEMAGLNTSTFTDRNSDDTSTMVSPLLSNIETSTLITRDRPNGSLVGSQVIPACTSVRTDCRLNDQNATSFEIRSDVGWMNPRSDYGLWFDTYRFMRMDDPPLDIVPFLGKGGATFAGRLFWACGEHLLEMCQKAELYVSANPRAARKANERIWNMVQHSPPLHNTRYIKALAEARREFRDRGYIEGNNPAGEPDSAELLQEHVLADYESRGQELTGWLSPITVELELRKRLSHEGSRRFEQALQTWDSKPAENPLGEVLQSLIRSLAFTFVCFGNGPRWRADQVMAILGGDV